MKKTYNGLQSSIVSVNRPLCFPVPKYRSHRSDASYYWSMDGYDNDNFHPMFKVDFQRLVTMGIIDYVNCKKLNSNIFMFEDVDKEGVFYYEVFI